MKCHEKSDESVGPRAFVTAMATGFTAPIALGAAVQQRNALTCTRPRNRVSVNVATVAEAYISVAGVRDGKALANRYGTTAKQCLEGTAASNSADAKRVATLWR